MKHEFRLADIGEGLEEAEVIAWRVQVGDVVARDQAIVEVMTDKSNADLPAPWSGTIVALGAAVGEMMTVGDLVAVIDDQAIDQAAGNTTAPAASARTFAAVTDSATAPTSFFSQTTAPTTATSKMAGTSSPAGEPAPAVPVRRSKASPTTRREASRRGIDLALLTGSGPGGRILLSDLDRYEQTGDVAAVSPEGRAQFATPAPPQSIDQGSAATADLVAPPRQADSADSAPVADSTQDWVAQPSRVAASARPAGVEPLRGVRRVIARNMTKSWQEVPHIHAWREIDAEPLMALRQRLRESGRQQYLTLTPLAFFVAAVAQSLREFPIVNSSLDFAAETITTHADVNVGVAVASPNGLVVPVLRNADQLTLAETALQINELVSNARSGDLEPGAFKGGTATISNFGSLGGENATPILRPPESAIVGFGSIAARPLVVDSAVVARQTMNVVVGADHRLLDGDITTAFLNSVCERLSTPVDLALGL